MSSPWDSGTDASSGLWGNDRAARDKAWSDVGLNPSGRYPGFDLGKRGIVGLFPTIGQQVNFAGEMEPIREQMIRNFITQNSPGNQTYLIDAARRNTLSQGLESQNQMAVNGMGGAFTDPGTAFSDANQAGSNAFNTVHSPQYQNALYQNVLGAVNQGQNITMLPAAEAFHNMTLSTPRNMSGLQTIGSLLGGGLQAMMGGGTSGIGNALTGGGNAGGGVGGGLTSGISNLTGGGGGGGTDWSGLNTLGWY